MDVNEIFPSKYLSGKDLEGRAAVVRISRMASVNMPDRESGGRVKKHVLYFADKKRGVVLNRTTALQIAEALSQTDTNKWMGQYIELFPVTIEAFGKTHCVVNFRKASKIPVPKVQPAAAVVDQQTGEVMDGQPSE